MLLQRLDADYTAAAIGEILGKAAGDLEINRNTIKELIYSATTRTMIVT